MNRSPCWLKRLPAESIAVRRIKKYFMVTLYFFDFTNAKKPGRAAVEDF
jgi:hypothetical protein